MRKWNRTSALCVFLAAALLSGGCGAFGSEDDDPDVAGSYTASTFTAKTDTSTVGVLEAGGSLRITLNEDGTASGRLRIPCSLPGACEPDEGDSFDVSFEGIYEVDGRTVTFDHRADTFIRDQEWTYRDGTLRTAFEDDDVRITVELARE